MFYFDAISCDEINIHTTGLMFLGGEGGGGAVESLPEFLWRIVMK